MYLVTCYRVGGVDVSDIPSLDLLLNRKLASNYMADLRRQGITLNDKNNPVPENIPYQETQQLNPLNLESRKNCLSKVVQTFIPHL